MFLLILYQLCFLKPMSLLLLMVFKHPFPPQQKLDQDGGVLPIGKPGCLLWELKV